MQVNLRFQSSFQKLIMLNQSLRRGRINQVNVKHHHQGNHHHHNVAEVAPQEEKAAKAAATLGLEAAEPPPLGQPPHPLLPAINPNVVVTHLQVTINLALSVVLDGIIQGTVMLQQTSKLATRSISNTLNPTMWKSMMKKNLKHTM